STAFAANGSQVVGQAQTASGQQRAFLVEDYRTGGMINLGTLGGSWSAAYDVNANAGIVVGASRTAGNLRLRAFQFENGAMSAIVDWGGDSVARGVNSFGDIVGDACTAGNGMCHGFLFSGGVAINLGTLGGATVAADISDNGHIVGSSVISGTTRHAFMYLNGSLQDLGTLGGASSDAKGVNHLGEVVGSSENATGQTRAFLWRNGGMTDLNTMVPAGSGWVLQSAASISEGGQIVGTGTFNGATRAFLLTPATDLEIWRDGIRTLTASNLPRGLEVGSGRLVQFVISARALTDAGLSIYGARITHTLTGPAEFVEGFVFDGEPCDVTPKVVTCLLPPFDAVTGLGPETWLKARATGAGDFFNRSVLTSDVPDPNESNNSLTEANWAVALAALTLTPASLPGGNAASAVVTLTQDAPGGGGRVRLSSSRPELARVPDTVEVPFSNTRGFNIVPAAVAAPTEVQITATYGLVTVTKTLTILPPALRQFYLVPTTVIGGCGTSTGKILLTGSAVASGAIVSLSNTNPKAAVPTGVTVGGGASVRTFTIPTSPVTALVNGNVTASYGGVSQALRLTVRPIRAKTLTLTPNPVKGGTTVTGTVTLECPAAPGAVVVGLTSSNAGLAAPTVQSVTIPAGATTASFSVRTSPVAASTQTSIHAWVFGVRRSAVLGVTP
ncbi:MAG: DUF3466 family protein, partial [Vicinamibacterales bacterium]